MGLVAHAYNSSAWEAEWVTGQPRLQQRNSVSKNQTNQPTNQTNKQKPQKNMMEEHVHSMRGNPSLMTSTAKGLLFTLLQEFKLNQWSEENP